MSNDLNIPFRARYFCVQEFTQNGTSQFYVVAPDGAAIVPVMDDGRVMMIREFRANTGKMHWYLPAGRKKESDADLEVTVMREVREETGFAPRKIAHMFTTESKSKWYKQNKAFFIGWDLYESPLETGDEIKQPEVHCLTPKEILTLLQKREIDDDMGDALYYFLNNYAFRDVTFHANVYDVVQGRHDTNMHDRPTMNAKREPT